MPANEINNDMASVKMSSKYRWVDCQVIDYVYSSSPFGGKWHTYVYF